MNKKKCESLGEKLVLFADGELEATEATEITIHLRECQDCRDLLAALKRSLKTAELIWHSSESKSLGSSQLPVNRLNRWRWNGAMVVAATIFIVLGGMLIWKVVTGPGDPMEPVNIEPTAAEIEWAANRSALAAQMLAAADMLEQQPGGENFARNRYVYLVKEYPETEFAEQARQRLDGRMENLQEN